MKCNKLFLNNYLKVLHIYNHDGIIIQKLAYYLG